MNENPTSKNRRELSFEQELLDPVLASWKDAEDSRFFNELIEDMRKNKVNWRALRSFMQILRLGIPEGKEQKISTLGEARDAVGILIKRFGEPSPTMVTGSKWHYMFYSMRVGYSLFFGLLPILRRSYPKTDEQS